MKKLISLLLVVFTLALPSFSAFAAVGGEAASDDYYISDEDFAKLEHVDSESNFISTYSSGLIQTTTLSLAKSGSTLIIKATTKGSDAVKKCGFTYIKLQQYKNGSWVNYKTYEDVYKESTSCTVTKSISAAKGYKYRVVAQHYAKKSLLSTEKISNSTSTLSL